MDNPYIASEITRIENEIKANEALINDPDLGSLAKAEVANLQVQLESLQTSSQPQIEKDDDDTS